MTHVSSAPLLLVESDKVSRAALAELLRRRHLVSEVESGAAALHHLSLGAMPCMILCVLRDGDDSGGFRIAQQADPLWSAVPTVMFSAQSQNLSDAFVDALLTLAGRHCETLQ